jgi:error-prone DNA polymerase
VFEAFRAVALKSRLMGVTGKIQREGEVIHVVAERLVDLSPLLPTLAGDAAATGSGKPGLGVRSRDFH